ncbi:glycerophosphodiester phosphodiesterase [Photobacterium gaetbulicola]|uniref:Glycerophosphodiester phosphodiesterase n=1 Tax=Photobacterium gaetbulicola TaxID=1295392 RepID=A0A0B9G1D2_9GAMM|nr:glycerophosphoryl diester phosphodiesterase [Photobacterium gaetbulicola]KHT62543.1 glycerophosphodiester phosphodiesterase [Photobacterium gaetbulicola]
MTKIFAHRGMSTLAPENTLSAFSLCKQHGIQWIECDVDILADGTVVISHDDTLDRCTDCSGSLYDLTKDNLRDIDAGSWFHDDFIGEKIPTFDQLITLVNKHKLNLNVEIKSCTSGWKMTSRLLDNVIQALEGLEPNRELIVSSFNHLALSEFKRRRPNTPIACLFEDANLWEDWHSILEACQAEYIHPEDINLTKDKIDKFRSAGYKVNVYTVNDLARANQLFNWGVDGVFTDIAQQFPSKYKKQ